MLRAVVDAPRPSRRPIAATPVGVAPARGARLERLRLGLGALAVATIVGLCFLLAAGAASRATGQVPGSVGGFPGWLAGPWHGLHIPLSHLGFQRLQFVLFGAYLVAVLCAEALPLTLILGGAVLANLVLVLGPVLLSQDAFGYLSFARLGALHGLDPYTHTSSAQPLDAVYPFLGWHQVVSPYGPLWTLFTYALVPLGVAGGIWALKIVAGLAASAAVLLTARTAERLGRSPRFAAAFLGLHPVLLTFAVGGAHNDVLLVAFLALAVACAASARPGRGAAAAVVGMGIKVSAGLLIPYMLLSRETDGRRRTVAVSALVTLVVVVLVAVAGFGPHALDFVNALRGQQRMVSGHSVPAELAGGLGIHGFPGWWRALVDTVFGLVAVTGLWRTWRGADWRTAAGWATLALVASTAWFLSWYVIWILPLAALSRDRALRLATVLLSAYAILYHLPFARKLGIS